MQNPFESGHIKNYILLYAAVVLIMILFFIASTLFHDVQEVEKKTFNTESKNVLRSDNKEADTQSSPKAVKENESRESRFKLLDKAY